VNAAWHTAPAYRQTFGPLAAELAELAGVPADQSQRLVLDDLFARTGDGAPAAAHVAVIAPDPAMKRALLLQAAVAWLFLTDEQYVLWSVHGTGRPPGVLDDLAAVLAAPALAGRVARISRARGGEAVELRSGGRLVVRSRAAGGGHGINGTRLILDDAHLLEFSHAAALVPVIAATRHQQALYAAVAGLNEGPMLPGLRALGRAGLPDLAYAEWPPSGTASPPGRMTRGTRAGVSRSPRGGG
jgi:hypothetical protein